MDQVVPYQNIVVSGDIGSGKSTLAKNLAKVLGWKYVSAGAFFRQWHRDHKISLQDTGQIPEDLDRKIDGGFQTQMKQQKGIVFESHLAGWLAKDFDQTYKILVTADFKERMKRVSLREKTSLKQISEKSKERAKLLADKFKKLYGVENTFEEKYFDLVIDSTNKNRDEVLETALKGLTSSF